MSLNNNYPVNGRKIAHRDIIVAFGTPDNSVEVPGAYYLDSSMYKLIDETRMHATKAAANYGDVSPQDYIDGDPAINFVYETNVISAADGTKSKPVVSSLTVTDDTLDDGVCLHNFAPKCDQSSSGLQWRYKNSAAFDQYCSLYNNKNMYTKGDDSIISDYEKYIPYLIKDWVRSGEMATEGSARYEEIKYHKTVAATTDPSHLMDDLEKLHDAYPYTDIAKAQIFKYTHVYNQSNTVYTKEQYDSQSTGIESISSLKENGVSYIEYLLSVTGAYTLTQYGYTFTDANLYGMISQYYRVENDGSKTLLARVLSDLQYTVNSCVFAQPNTALEVPGNCELKVQFIHTQGTGDFKSNYYYWFLCAPIGRNDTNYIYEYQVKIHGGAAASGGSVYYLYFTPAPITVECYVFVMYYDGTFAFYNKKGKAISPEDAPKEKATIMPDSAGVLTDVGSTYTIPVTYFGNNETSYNSIYRHTYSNVGQAYPCNWEYLGDEVASDSSGSQYRTGYHTFRNKFTVPALNSYDTLKIFTTVMGNDEKISYGASSWPVSRCKWKFNIICGGKVSTYGPYDKNTTSGLQYAFPGQEGTYATNPYTSGDIYTGNSGKYDSIGNELLSSAGASTGKYTKGSVWADKSGARYYIKKHYWGENVTTKFARNEQQGNIYVDFYRIPGSSYYWHWISSRNAYLMHPKSYYLHVKKWGTLGMMMNTVTWTHPISGTSVKITFFFEALSCVNHVVHSYYYSNGVCGSYTANQKWLKNESERQQWYCGSYAGRHDVTHLYYNYQTPDTADGEPGLRGMYY